MARPRYQGGSLVVRGKREKLYVIRWREDLMQPDGTFTRIQRAETLGPVSQIKKQEALEILRARVSSVSLERRSPAAFVSFSEFIESEWKPNAALSLKNSSLRIYTFNLEKYILPRVGSIPLRGINRSTIESCLSNLKANGLATSTLRNVRATFSTVLQCAVSRNCMDRNPTHGLQIRESDVREERRFYSPAQIRLLLGSLTGQCHDVVLIAVATGMRIGEILGLRWKRVDLLRSTIEVAEIFSSGEFGTPKTKSSRRVLPIAPGLRGILESMRPADVRPDALVFETSKGTPLSSKNLYNRELAPACDRLGLPRVSWHAFRHSHATLLNENGESLKTAQALLGHSDLETTLGTYIHVVPDTQRRAVAKVENVVFSDVLNSESLQKLSGVVN